jgi:hypothetical protein
MTRRNDDLFRGCGGIASGRKGGAVNSRALIVVAASPVRLDDPAPITGARVLVIEVGPTITYSGMAHGASDGAAKAAGTATIVDPRESAVPKITAIFRAYPHIGNVLPAVGRYYSWGSSSSFYTAKIESLRSRIRIFRAE